jgi:hypothetical protein
MKTPETPQKKPYTCTSCLYPPCTKQCRQCGALLPLTANSAGKDLCNSCRWPPCVSCGRERPNQHLPIYAVKEWACSTCRSKRDEI